MSATETLWEERPALKEWAAMVRALEAGEQAVLLRKGGIHERGFDVRTPTFFLYPTYLHQTAEKYRPEARHHFEATDAEGPGEERVPVRSVAEVVASFTTTDAGLLPELAELTILTGEELASRYAWKPEQALHVLLVRVHPLPAPLDVEVRPSYGGCRSWIKLQEAGEVQELPPPVLDEAALGELRERLESLLGAAAHA